MSLLRGFAPGSLIGDLLLSSGPPNIARLIVAVIVDPVNCVLGSWLHSQLRIELLKGIEKKKNSTTTVILEMFIFRRGAASFGRMECFIFTGTAEAMSRISQCDRIVMQASTTLGAPARKLVRGDIGLSSAVALTSPNAMMMSIIATYAKYDQAPEPPAGKVLKSIQARRIASQAAAAFSISTRKFMRRDFRAFPAVALAKPDAAIIAHADATYRNEPYESLTGDVFGARM